MFDGYNTTKDTIINTIDNVLKKEFDIKIPTVITIKDLGISIFIDVIKSTQQGESLIQAIVTSTGGGASGALAGILAAAILPVSTPTLVAIGLVSAIAATIVGSKMNDFLDRLWKQSENIDAMEFLDKLLNGSLIYDLITSKPSNELMDNLFTNFTELRGKVLLRRAIYGDPLVVDLDGDGIETIRLDSSNAMFDIDGDGFREKTGWISKISIVKQNIFLVN